MRTLDSNAAFGIIHQIATAKGFQQKVYNNEVVWAKGDGVVMQVQAFTAQFTGHSMVIWGWMDDALAGESSLDGFLSSISIPKKKMKKIMNEMAAAIQAQGL